MREVMPDLRRLALMANVGYPASVLEIAEVRTAVFFFNHTATTEIYTLSLHDALPICGSPEDAAGAVYLFCIPESNYVSGQTLIDRKSTRLNFSHSQISYAVFCLKKKNTRRDRRASAYIEFRISTTCRLILLAQAPRQFASGCAAAGVAGGRSGNRGIA